LKDIIGELMKIKLDHVTNSSSASFTILKRNLTDLQILFIKNHIEVAKVLSEDLKYEIYDDPWRIINDGKYIIGQTMMDNFDMLWFLRTIGVEDKVIEYDKI